MCSKNKTRKNESATNINIHECLEQHNSQDFESRNSHRDRGNLHRACLGPSQSQCRGGSGHSLAKEELVSPMCRLYHRVCKPHVGVYVSPCSAVIGQHKMKSIVLLEKFDLIFF